MERRSSRGTDRRLAVRGPPNRPPSRDRFAWLKESPSRMHVFITFLVGGGLLFSSIAWVVDRLASATTTPVGEQRLARAADVVGDIEPVGDGGRFRAVLTPTMVETNRRQFRGCLEDWLVDHIQIDVLSLEPRG